MTEHEMMQREINQLKQRLGRMIETLRELRSSFVDDRNVVEWRLMDVDTALAEATKPLEEQAN